MIPRYLTGNGPLQRSCLLKRVDTKKRRQIDVADIHDWLHSLLDSGVKHGFSPSTKKPSKTINYSPIIHKLVQRGTLTTSRDPGSCWKFLGSDRYFVLGSALSFLTGRKPGTLPEDIIAEMALPCVVLSLWVMSYSGESQVELGETMCFSISYNSWQRINTWFHHGKYQDRSCRPMQPTKT